MEPRDNLEERPLECAERIALLVDRLPGTQAGDHVGGQLLRSGTSRLPNNREAQAVGAVTRHRGQVSDTADSINGWLAAPDEG